MEQKGSKNKQNINKQPDDEENDFLHVHDEKLHLGQVAKEQKSGDDDDQDQQGRQEGNEQQILPNQNKVKNIQDINQEEKEQQNRELLNQQQVQNNQSSGNVIKDTQISYQNQVNNLYPSKIVNENKDNPNDKQNNQKINQIQTLLDQLTNQLNQILSQKIKNNTNNSTEQSNNQKIKTLEQQIQTLSIKLRLQQKILKQKQLTSIDRINHLDHIFKHYCTHIFKTGKHMTFDRLEYEKVHLTIDRFFVFLKDFNLTCVKTKDGKIREIIDKQEVIKLFKKVSPNCRDLNFEQFIIMIEKLGEIYFDSKLTYEQRKVNQRKERLKIKQNLQKKEKYKQQMLKKYKQKMQNLQRVVNTVENNINQKVETQGGQNDNLVEQLMKQNGIQMDNQVENIEKVVQSKEVINNMEVKQLTGSKIKKSTSLYTRSFKKQPILKQQKPQQNPLSNLTKHEKREYFYEVINVDDAQSFMNKLRQLNLPLFKIYASQNAKEKDTSQSRKKQQRPNEIIVIKKQQQIQQEKRLKQLRKKLNERNQKLKNSSVPLLSKQEYEQRKLKRSRMEQQYGLQELRIKDKKKSAKIDISNSEINLQSLSKLNYENLNFNKFDPKSLFSKEDDDKIFLKQYEDSPAKPRKLNKNFTQLSRVTQNTKRVLQQKDKSSSSFLQKLKQRQSQVEINQKKQQISQLYRLNDRTQRQKQLVDKFLQKNNR